MASERAAAATAAGKPAAAAGDNAEAAAGAPAGGAAAAVSAEGAAAADNTGGFGALQETDKEYWERFIEKQIRTYVQLIVEKKTQNELELAIRDSALAIMRGDPAGLVLDHYGGQHA